MSKIFNIDGKQYVRKQYTCGQIAEKILPSMYGTTISDITYEQLVFIRNVMNDGWKLLPGFYGEKSSTGTLLKPNVSWFSFVGSKLDNKGNFESHHWYLMCVNYNKYEVTLYDFEHAMGTFPSYADMLACTGTDKFSSMIPSIFTGYNSPFVLVNIEDFENRGCQFDDEIYRKDNKVYENMDNMKLNVHIDYDNLEEIQWADYSDMPIKDKKETKIY